MPTSGKIRDVNRELWLLLSIFAIAALLHFTLASHHVLLSLYGLPVLGSAYIYGRRHAVMTALASILIVSLLLEINPRSFLDHLSSGMIQNWLDCVIWGGILMVTAYGMGTLREHLEHQALYDDLTGLPNRRLFRDRLEHALAGSKRRNSIVALIYIDLDGFKLVNDTLGHTTGDILLREVACRLSSRVRAANTLARIGGDEFAVVAEDLSGIEHAETIANALLAEFRRPFSSSGQELTLTASLGICFYPNDAADAEQLIRQADTAMYVAKKSGKNGFKLFASQYGDAVREQLELENQLRGAVERSELVVHYQPEYETSTHRLVRLEALVRWNHPTLGVIPPLKFIPIAEDTGLIIPIGIWIMEQACMEAVKWQARSEGPVQLAVNVSAIQLRNAEFVASVAAVLNRTGLSPDLLQLELTESVLVPELFEATGSLFELRALGVRIAIDDFGTGYSSLSYLHQMPFDFVKIDRSFLAQASQVGQSHATLLSIVELAHNLRMTVIVEGVETAHQLDLVTKLGCDEFQGYLKGKPTADPSQFFAEKNQRNVSESAMNSLELNTEELGTCQRLRLDAGDTGFVCGSALERPIRAVQISPSMESV